MDVPIPQNEDGSAAGVRVAPAVEVSPAAVDGSRSRTRTSMSSEFQLAPFWSVPGLWLSVLIEPRTGCLPL